MSGGIAYVFDPKRTFAQNINMEMVVIDEKSEGDEQLLRSMILEHITHTGSEVAALMIKNWDKVFDQFKKVMPAEYKAVLAKKKLHEKQIAVKA